MTYVDNDHKLLTVILTCCIMVWKKCYCIKTNIHDDIKGLMKFTLNNSLKKSHTLTILQAHFDYGVFK